MRRVLLVLPLSLAAACGQPRTAAPEGRTQTLDGLVLRQSEAGRPSWTLKARLAILREDQKKALLSEPSMEFLREGKVVSRVTALSGEVDTETRDVRLSQSVTLDSLDDRSRLSTEELVYSSARKRFRTDREVLVKRPDATLRGAGLEATPDLSEIRVFNQRTDIKGRTR